MQHTTQQKVYPQKEVFKPLNIIQPGNLEKIQGFPTPALQIGGFCITIEDSWAALASEQLHEKLHNALVKNIL